MYYLLPGIFIYVKILSKINSGRNLSSSMISTTYKRNEQKNQTRKENGKKYSNMPIVEV